MLIKPKRPGPQEASITTSDVVERDMEEARQMIRAGDTTVKIADWLGWTNERVNLFRRVVAMEWMEEQRMDALLRENLDFIQKNNPKVVAAEMVARQRRAQEAIEILRDIGARLANGELVIVQATVNRAIATLEG